MRSTPRSRSLRPTQRSTMGATKCETAGNATTSLPDAPTMKLIGLPRQILLARSRAQIVSTCVRGSLDMRWAKGCPHLRTLGPKPRRPVGPRSPHLDHSLTAAIAQRAPWPAPVHTDECSADTPLGGSSNEGITSGRRMAPHCAWFSTLPCMNLPLRTGMGAC
jgi:hypothetical protein